MVRVRAPEPLFDIHPHTGAPIEVFYADRALETFGRQGAGWFWCYRRRGYSAGGLATGPFPTRYAAYRHATDDNRAHVLTRQR
jgi:hypothetical protein